MGDDDGEFGEDEDIARAIICAAVAGGLRHWAAPHRTRDLDERRGLTKSASEFSAAATALLNCWIARQPLAAGRPAQEDRLNRPGGGSLT